MNVQNAARIQSGWSKNICSGAELQDATTLKFNFPIILSKQFTLSFVSNEALQAASVRMFSTSPDYHNWGIIGNVSGLAGGRASANITLTDQVYSELQAAITKGASTYLTVYKNGANFNVPSYPQIENGLEMTAYTPYVAPTEYRCIHDKDSRLIWGRLEYDTKYAGDIHQTVYTGKNLFDPEYFRNATYTTGVYKYTTASFISTGVTYSVSCKLKEGASKVTGAYVYFSNAANPNNASIKKAAVGNGTPSAAGTMAYNAGDTIYFQFYPTTLTIDQIVDAYDIQVETGAMATSFEPFVGGIPSPNPDYPQDVECVTGDQTITISGKNLFTGNFSQFDNVGGTGVLYSYFKLPDDGKYTMTLVAKNSVVGTAQTYIGFTTTGGEQTNPRNWAFYDGVSMSAGDIVTKTNVSTGGNLQYVSIYASGEETFNWFKNNFYIQIERGEYSTGYEQYMVSEFPLDLVGRNKANPQTFIDWANRTYQLCVDYNWGSDSSRPKVGSYDGRSNVVSWVSNTLYSVRDQMVNPTYDEARVIYSGIFRENTQYTISADVSGPTNWHVLYTDGTTGAIPGSSSGWTSVTYTTTAGKTVSAIRMSNNTSTTYVDLETLQIVEGTSAGTFVPYDKPFGKNLLGPAAWRAVATSAGYPVPYPPAATITSSDDNSVTFNMPNTYGGAESCFIPVKAGEVYTVSFTGNNLPNRLFITQYDSSKTRISTLNHSSVHQVVTTTVTTTDVGYITVAFAATTTSGTYGATNIQVEVGPTASTYNPYIPGPIKLYKIGAYNDYLYKSSGKWYLRRIVYKKTMSELSGWGRKADGQFYLVGYASATGTVNTTMYSNIFTYSGTAWSIVGFGLNSSGDLWMDTGDTTLTSQANVPAWLSGKNAVMYAVSSTASTAQITDTTLIAQLDAIHEWMTRYGYYATVVGDLPIAIDQEEL